MASGCLRNIPSPEQGASGQSHQSKTLNLAKRSADSLVTTTFICKAQIAPYFPTKILARLAKFRWKQGLLD